MTRPGGVSRWRSQPLRRARVCGRRAAGTRPRRHPATWLRRAGGFTATEFALGAGVLLLPVVLVAASLPVWVEQHNAARVAAREAAREVASADDMATGWQRGLDVVTAVAANRGATLEDAAVEGTLDRGGAVTVRVTARLPAIVVPLAGTVGGFSWTAAHTEAVDPYRSVP